MAVIGRIRKRVGLLIAFVGISMVLFILGDLVTSNKGIMGGSSDVLGVVNGEKIRYQEFEKKVETLIENYKTNSKVENVDENTKDMLREQGWSMVVSENTLGKEYEKLGLVCSPDELYDMVTGKNPHDQIKSAFTDPKTGMFDPQTVVRFLKDLPNRDEATQKQWSAFEVAIREERIAQKYKDLIKGAMYVSTLEAKNNYMEASRIANLQFVELNFFSIADSAAKFEESDLKTYYNAHQNDFKQPETIRKVEYVAFDINPSEQDRSEIKGWMAKKMEEFAASTNDTLFVNQNSDNLFDNTYHAKGTLRPVLDTTVFNASIGTIVGPYEEENSLKISKVMNVKMVPDSMKARHILLKVENGDTTKTMAVADSLKGLIKKGAKFADLAMKFSQDPGSGMKGGDLGWFRAGMMVPPFNDACFEGKKGDMPVVKSQFGVHLIEILERGTVSKQVLIGTVARKVEPSQKTYDALYNKANQFAAANNTGELFDSACVKQGLNKRIADNIRENDKNIPGLEQPREMIRWAYKAKKGDVSKAFTLGDKYVIAHLTEIREKGILPLEYVKPQVTAAVIKEKKADMLLEKFNKEAAGATTLAAVAQKLNSTVTDADNINFSNVNMPVGSEPSVVATAFTLKQGELSKPIKGNTGVFMITVKNFTEPAAAKDYELNRSLMLNERKNRSDYEVFNALKEKANIEDNRGKFY